MVPRMEKAVSDAIESNLPLAARDEWVEFEPYQVLGRVSARAAAEVIVGPAFCENPVWLDISFNYTENREQISQLPVRRDLGLLVIT